MEQLHSPHNQTTRRLGGVALLILAIVVSAIVGVAAFFGAAAVGASILVLSVVGLAALAVVAVLLTQPGLRLLAVRQPWRAGVAIAALLAVAMAGLAAATIFQPMPTVVAGPVPAEVEFWDLPAGSRLAYVYAPAEGAPKASPVIFLHGGPGTPGEGIPEAGTMLNADGFDVYAYDQLGAGRSTRLDDVTGYTVARHVADLEAIRETIGAEQLILVGRSWGATLAAAYLAAHPDRVEKVVFVSPGALWGGEIPDSASGGIEDRLTPEQRQAVDDLTSSPRILAAALLQAINPNAAHALVPDDEADAFMRRIMLAEVDATVCPGNASPVTHDNRPGFYVNQITAADAEQVPDPRPILQTVDVPALIMRGECDYLTWPVADDYRQTLPNATLVYIEGAGHAIPSDQPVLYEDTLRAFLLDEPLPLAPYAGTEPPA